MIGHVVRLRPRCNMAKACSRQVVQRSAANASEKVAHGLAYYRAIASGRRAARRASKAWRARWDFRITAAAFLIDQETIASQTQSEMLVSRNTLTTTQLGREKLCRQALRKRGFLRQ